MAKKNLVIVESPTKAKTIGGFLGQNFMTVSSVGHVRDLPRTALGVDLENDYEPKYLIPKKAKPIVKELKEKAQKAGDIYLATDYDREGEAIAWHLAEALDLNRPRSKKNLKRITFHEITQSAIMAALEEPRKIDMNLVDAQQARRVLDRLVGYKLSPFLWQKVARGLSAGRVQSVALRFVVDREREIETFRAKEYWLIGAVLETAGKKFEAFIAEQKGEKIEKLSIGDEKQAKAIVESLAGADWIVADVEEKEAARQPLPPFITASLQQEAGSRLRFSAKRTMTLAQRLYERGHITYMRTDSPTLADSAVKEARRFIVKSFGSEYLPDKPNLYRTRSRNAQEAHEAIRPTDPGRSSGQISGLESDQTRLYDLIFKRLIASQMKPARYHQVLARIKANQSVFEARGRSLIFDGFLRVYGDFKIGQESNDRRDDQILPELKSDQALKLIELKSDQKFTQPPARYTEASLIKALEREGIGRPSTYAPILSAIADRGYVEIEDRKLKPTELGQIVNNLLVKNFPQIVEPKFTAHMEAELDDVADGKTEWKKVIKGFYKPFEKRLEEKLEFVKKDEAVEKTTDLKCPKCGKPLLDRLGRFGRFYACSGFPDCDYTGAINDGDQAGGRSGIQSKIDSELTELLKNQPRCKKCGRDMVLKHGRFGAFLGCSDYPNCKTTVSVQKKVGLKCPDCRSGDVIERRTKKGRRFFGCSRYPKCHYINWTNPAVKSQGKNDR